MKIKKGIFLKRCHNAGCEKISNFEIHFKANGKEIKNYLCEACCEELKDELLKNFVPKGVRNAPSLKKGNY